MKRKAVSIVFCFIVVLSISPLTSIQGSASPSDTASYQTDNTTRPLSSGEQYWRGFQLKFDASQIIENPKSASVDDRTFQIRSSHNNTIGELVKEFTVGEDGVHIIETTKLSGQYIIQYKSNIIFVKNGIGYQQGSNSTTGINESSWKINSQKFTTSWEDPTLYNGEVTEIRLQSNRKSSKVEVSSRSLDYSDLTRLFSKSDYAENFAAKSGEDILILKTNSKKDYNFSVSSLPPGTYELKFESPDTVATHVTQFKVKNETKFRSIEHQEHAGDMIDVSVNCNQCYLIVGGANVGYVDIVELQDGNGDGLVNLTVNSRYMGLSPSASGVPSQAEPYSSQTDSVNRYGSSDILESRVTNVQLNSLRSDLGLHPSGRSNPISSGKIDFTISSSDFVMSRNQYGEHRSPLGGDPAVRDEQAVNTVWLKEPKLGEVTVYAQPTRINRRPLESLSPRQSPQKRIAIGDRLLVQIEAPSIIGYLNYENNNIESLVSNNGEGVSLKIKQSPGSAGLWLNQGSNFVVTDERFNRVFVSIDTSRSPIIGKINPGSIYHVSFSLSGVDGSHSSYDVYGSPSQFNGYPYVQPGETISSSSTIQFVEPSVSITSSQSNVILPNQKSITITGNTTLAPGTIFTLTVSETTGPNWEKSTSVKVGPDQKWSTTLDLSNTKAGDNISVKASKNSKEISRFNGKIVKAEKLPKDDRSTPIDDAETDSGTEAEGSITTSQPEPDEMPIESPSTQNDDSNQLFGLLDGGKNLNAILLPIGAVISVILIVGLFLKNIR